VVWDWNGTLLDDFHACFSATNAAFAPYRVELTVEEYHRCITRPLEAYYAKVLKRALWPGEYERLQADWTSAYNELVARCELRDGAVEVLTLLAAAGTTQSLLSMWDDSALEAEVIARSIDDHFVVVQGSCPGHRVKGPLLREHISALGVSADRILVVGDSADDANAARALGAHCVLVSSGYESGEVLAATGVPVVRHLREITVQIEHLSGPPTAPAPRRDHPSTHLSERPTGPGRQEAEDEQ
jgi:phosphoglycolate phosphatase-like HAD superfamily hydrolase